MATKGAAGLIAKSPARLSLAGKRLCTLQHQRGLYEEPSVTEADSEPPCGSVSKDASPCGNLPFHASPLASFKRPPTRLTVTTFAREARWPVLSTVE